MRFVGGDLQGEFMARVRGVDPRRCLAVPVDVGKWSAMALVADHHGEVVVAPFSVNLDEPGVGRLMTAIKVAPGSAGGQAARDVAAALGAAPLGPAGERASRPM